MLGMGSGQPNRLESLRIAMKKAGDEVKGAALASDAFFPFGNNYSKADLSQDFRFCIILMLMQTVV